jgi:hypothetical protein
VPVHNEGAPRLLSAIRAVAAPDVDRVTAHAVADRPAEASAGAYSRLHTSMVRNTSVGQRAGMSSESRRQGPLSPDRTERHARRRFRRDRRRDS